jgi:hypothetical protein
MILLLLLLLQMRMLLRVLLRVEKRGQRERNKRRAVSDQRTALEIARPMHPLRRPSSCPSRAVSVCSYLHVREEGHDGGGGGRTATSGGRRTANGKRTAAAAEARPVEERWGVWMRVAQLSSRVCECFI